MPGRLLAGPHRNDLLRLERLIESATEGTQTLDGEVAKTFFRRRNLVRKDGELFWVERDENGPLFEAVPQYTRRLDAVLPHEHTHKVEVSGDIETRWHAYNNRGIEVDAASEPLARRLLALRTLRISKRAMRKKSRDTLPVISEKSAVEHEDQRDVIISAMANELKRLLAGKNYAPLDIPEREFLSTRNPSFESRAPQSPGVQPKKIPLISEFTKIWQYEENPSAKSIDDIERTVRRFIEVNGDLPMNSIKKVHVRELLVRIRDLPRVLPQKLKKYSIKFGVEYGRQHPEIPKITPSTIEAHRINLSILLNWAFRRDYVEHNAAAGFSIRDRRPQAAKRRPFDISDLKDLFETSTLYHGHAINLRSEPGPHVFRDGKFWMPLIALFTGARLSELMNLWPSDLRSENQIYYLDITKGGTINTIKTQSAERKLPIHPELIRIGIVDYFEAKQRRGDRYVFSDLGRETPKGLVGKHWGEKWRRIQRNSGFDHPKKTFHSFRHTFKGACRASKIPEEIHDAFTGHKYNLAGRKYGGQIPLPILFEYMETLQYPTLNLSHLHQKSSDTI